MNLFENLVDVNTISFFALSALFFLLAIGRFGGLLGFGLSGGLAGGSFGGGRGWLLFGGGGFRWHVDLWWTWLMSDSLWAGWVGGASGERARWRVGVWGMGIGPDGMGKPVALFIG